MKKLLMALLCLTVFACNQNKKDYQKPENALDAGRSFIEHSLKGEFSTAKRYMIQDKENLYWLDKVSKDYNGISEKDKAGFSSSSIKINEVADVSDSITVINYSNSYKNRSQKVKVVNYGGDWLVDFKYTFSGNL